jgi:hypothetical protein
MKKILLLLICFTIFAGFPQLSIAQDGNDIFAADDDDLNIGGDIFSDFNEELESAKVAEDERFYRFGRFFSFNVGLGFTWFDGNRGTAYKNLPPSYALSFTFFKDFQTALNLGLEYSKHTMFLAGETEGFPNDDHLGIGMVEIGMLRVFLGYRYYIDTANLGTALTYSNPYFIGRLEYWYQNNKYVDQRALASDSGGGLGTALGFGLEFPIEIKESYWGIEFLFHSVNFFDKNTNRYQPTTNNANGYGYDDLTGNTYSAMINYVFNW